MGRIKFLLDGIDREAANGIDIGPFVYALVPKSRGWNIRAMTSNIERVDVIWRDKRLDETCLALPSSFELIILELNTLGLIDSKVERLVNGDGSEFLVQLRREHHQFGATELQERRLAPMTATRHELSAPLRHLTA